MKSIKELSSWINRPVSLRTWLLGGYSVFALVAVVLVLVMSAVFGGYQAIDRDRRETAQAVRAAERLKAAVAVTMFETADYSAWGAGEGRRSWREAVDRVGELESATAAALESATEGAQDRFTPVRRGLDDLRVRQAVVFAASAPAESREAARRAATAAENVGFELDKIVASLDLELKGLGGSAARLNDVYASFTWLAMAILVLVTFALGLLTYTTLISRLKEIREGVRRVAAGTVSVRLDERGRDELAALSADFNRMVAYLAVSEDEQRRRYSQLTNLYKISKEMSASQDIDKLLAHVLNHSLKLMGAETGSIMLLNKACDELIIRAARGLDEETIRDTRVKLGQGISGTVALTGEPLIIQDGIKESKVPGSRAANDALSVPLIAGERVIGVINANNKRRGRFDRSDLRFFTTLGGQMAAAIAHATLIESIQAAYFNTIKVLAAAIDAKDPYTHGHSERVAKYAVTIASRMGLSKSDRTRIEAAAYLHDIGKIGVPDGILNKSGKLTSEEMALIKNHPAIAADILVSIEFPWGDVVPGVRGHHERVDGQGYPDGLAGYAISFDARIIAVADTFDAMTSDRPYRKALDQNKAISELVTGRRSQFDQEVVDAFVPVLLTTLMTSIRGGIEEPIELEFSTIGKPLVDTKKGRC